MTDIIINNSLVIIMDLKNMNPQTEKLTHAITLRVTEDDYIRHSRLSHTSKAIVKNALIRAIRTQYHMESLDPDNPPPLDFNNEA